MKKYVKESVEFMSPEWEKLDNIKVMKNRCRSFLKPDSGEEHGSWEKLNGIDNFYVGKYNVFAPDDGENYFVGSELEKISEGRKVKYLLKFSDINQIFDDQSFKPLRQLGALVFQNATIN